MNKTKIIAVAGVIGATIMPVICLGAAYDNTAAQSSISAFISDMGTMIAYVLTAAFVLGAALIGLWYGVRKLLRFLK